MQLKPEDWIKKHKKGKRDKFKPIKKDDLKHPEPTNFKTFGKMALEFAKLKGKS